MDVHLFSFIHFVQTENESIEIDLCDEPAVEAVEGDIEPNVIEEEIPFDDTSWLRHTDERHSHPTTENGGEENIGDEALSDAMQFECVSVFDGNVRFALYICC